MADWHSRRLSQVMEEVGGRSQGLTEREAAQRLEKYGPNQLAQPQPPSLLLRILAQLKDPMILVLLAAAALSLLASGGEDWLDGVIILVIVVVNGIISITQEDHAQQALEELRRMSSPRASVLREGPAGHAKHGATPSGVFDWTRSGQSGAWGNPNKRAAISEKDIAAHCLHTNRRMTVFKEQIHSSTPI